MPPKFSRQTDEKVIFPEWAISQPRTSPCEAHCPAGNPIQKVSTLIAANRIEEALSYLRARNPFPGITGRVCAHPCEKNCNRDSYDQAVAIRGLERFAADQADPTRTIRPRKRSASGKAIAIVGAGPAGLTCAYYSALFGHSVTIFESAPVAGGIPRLAIPGFRLPKDVVERESACIFELGVEARFNTRVGKDISLQSIMEDFDACVIAVGAGKERRMDIPGADMAIPGVAFLQKVNLGWEGPIGQSVVIIGGGGVAFDCAFTAKRLGAAIVTVVCLEGPGNMCASTEDLLMARDEGVKVVDSCAVKAIVHDGTKATAVEYLGISSFGFDDRGFLSVGCTTGESGVIAADTVISAIGVMPDIDFLAADHRFTLSPRGTVQVDPKSFSTPVAKVFAAGDVVSGSSTVAAAVGNGRHAAVAVDGYLAGREKTSVRINIGATGEIITELSPDPPPPHVVAFGEILNVDSHEKKERQRTEAPRPEPAKPPAQEIGETFGADAARLEAGRCFHCGHCTACGCCVTDCPLYVLSMTANGPEVEHFDECWHCGCCRIACPNGAVLYEFPLNMLV